jgi:hypothetical protein
MAKKNRHAAPNSGAAAPLAPAVIAQDPDAPSEPATAERATQSDTGAERATESGTGDPRERIAARAYALYLERGGEHGRDAEDWLAAERELSHRNGGSSSSDR